MIPHTLQAFVLLVGIFLMQNSLLHAKKTVNKTPQVGVFYSEQFLEHDTGSGHPERADRLRAILKAIQNDPIHSKLQWPSFKAATLTQIERVHPSSYLEIIQEDLRSGKTQLRTGDTALSPNLLKSQNWPQGLPSLA